MLHSVTKYITPLNGLDKIPVKMFGFAEKVGLTLQQSISLRTTLSLVSISRKIILSEITNMKPCIFLSVLLLLIISFNAQFSIASDSIFPGQSLSGHQTISSPGGAFELGFFTPGNSQNYYIGIWYKGLPNQTVVWVANRNQPVSNSFSASLKLSLDGNLILLNQSEAEIWLTNSTSSVRNSSIVMLLDNGNLVIKDGSNRSNVKWQSFDYPTDTWLPGGKIGYKQSLVSWKNSENPAPGLYSVEVEPNRTSYLLRWNMSTIYLRSGEWDGKIFSNVPEIQSNKMVKNFTLISNGNESYFTYDAAFPGPTIYTRFVLDVTGRLRQFVWRNDKQQWDWYWSRPTQECEVYAFCGAFSSCNQQIIPDKTGGGGVYGQSACSCMQGFEPRVSRDWELEDHSDGCMRKTPLQCGNGSNDNFFLMPNTNLPTGSESLRIASSEGCELACRNNCSCTGYAYDNGCLLWKQDLVDLQQLSSDNNDGKNFYVRVAASELVGTKGEDKGKTTWIVIGTIIGVSTLFACFILVTLWKRKRFSNAFEAGEDSLQLFKYKDLRSATKNFSDKLGEGSFGSVFKGTLPNLTTIAVKELKNLKKGEKQFSSEVSTIGIIQHKNLIRLRGFCVEASKRFLVYEYMPKGSLEFHLFRKSSNVLDWKVRYHIAVGMARGLSYLHEKCRDCIIHCDIKPENILLDAEYNPKVADFGLAKLLGRDFSRVLTTIRGTRGYLAPEWFSGEAVTPKADVFSYGKLLFEIISGRRNIELIHDGLADYFPIRVANVVDKGEDVITLLDDRLEDNADTEELTRACKVACWCIQDDEKDRPSMGKVVQVLEGVVEVDTPPIPRFLQRLVECPAETIVYTETPNTSNSTFESPLASTR